MALSRAHGHQGIIRRDDKSLCMEARHIGPVAIPTDHSRTKPASGEILSTLHRLIATGRSDRQILMHISLIGTGITREQVDACRTLATLSSPPSSHTQTTSAFSTHQKQQRAPTPDVSPIAKDMDMSQYVEKDPLAPNTQGINKRNIADSVATTPPVSASGAAAARTANFSRFHGTTSPSPPPTCDAAQRYPFSTSSKIASDSNASSWRKEEQILGQQGTVRNHRVSGVSDVEREREGGRERLSLERERERLRESREKERARDGLDAPRDSACVRQRESELNCGVSGVKHVLSESRWNHGPLRVNALRVNAPQQVQQVSSDRQLNHGLLSVDAPNGVDPVSSNSQWNDGPLSVNAPTHGVSRVDPPSIDAKEQDNIPRASDILGNNLRNNPNVGQQCRDVVEEDEEEEEEGRERDVIADEEKKEGVRERWGESEGSVEEGSASDVHVHAR